MSKKLILFSAIALTALLSSCSSTPTTRIEKNIELYNTLSVHEQELVSQGQIDEGMSPQAVFLALGEPDRNLEGQNDGVHTMRWDYTALQPVYSNSFHGGFRYGGFRGRRRGFGKFGFSPSITYIPIRAASVWFIDDRVDSWERSR